jgi:CelD/BcsL family acetyltransferase involved in cellulose biosynthesis
MDFAYSNDEQLGELAEAVLGLKRPLFLGRMPAGSPTISALRRAARGRAAIVVRPSAPSLFVPLGERWTDPLRALPSRRRNLMTRARRRAERIGPVEVRFHSPTTSTDLDPLLDELFAIEADGWKGRAGTALALGRQGVFVRTYAAAAAREGLLTIGVLTIGDVPAAAQLGVTLDQRFWWLKTGYRERFADAAPGRLLLLESIGRAARQGLVTHELMGLPDPFKRSWTSVGHENVAVALYPLWQLSSAGAVIRDAFGMARRRWRGWLTE